MEQARRETLYGLNGEYLDAYDAVVQPHQVLPIKIYMLRRWTQILGATGFWLVINLKQLCYQNSKGPNWCKISRKDLAEVSNLGEGTLHRYLRGDNYVENGLCHWIRLPSLEQTKKRRRWSTRAGRTTQDITRYTIVMDTPLAPVDQRGMAQFLQQVLQKEESITEALENLCEFNLSKLLSLMDEHAARFCPPEGWTDASFHPTVADVVKAVGIPLPTEKKDKIAFLDLCSQVQQAFMSQTYLGTQYFLRDSLLTTGHKLGLVITQLRSRCFWNENELRDRVSIGTKALAEASGCSPGWLRKVYKSDTIKDFFTVTEQGQGRQPEFQVVLCEPIAPHDKARYQALLTTKADPETGQFCLSLDEQSEQTRLVDTSDGTNAPGGHLGTQKTHLADTSDTENASDGRLGTKQTRLVDTSGETNAPGGHLGTKQTRLVDISDKTNAPGGHLGTGQTRLVDTSDKTNAPGGQHVSTIIINTQPQISLSLLSQQQKHTDASAAALDKVNIGPPKRDKILHCFSENEIRAWILYVITQPGLRKAVTSTGRFVLNQKAIGYLVNQMQPGKLPPPRFLDWARLAPSDWQSLWNASCFGDSHRGHYYLTALADTLDLETWQMDFGHLFPNGPFDAMGRFDWNTIRESLCQQLGVGDLIFRIGGHHIEISSIEVSDADDIFVPVFMIMKEHKVFHAVSFRVFKSRIAKLDKKHKDHRDWLWQATLGEMRASISANHFDWWLDDSRLVKRKDGIVVVAIRAGYNKKGGLSRDTVKRIANCYTRLCGRDAKFHFIPDPFSQVRQTITIGGMP